MRIGMHVDRQRDAVAGSRRALESDAKLCTEQLIHFLLNGYGCLWNLIKYSFHAQYLPYLNYGGDPLSAFRVLVRKKANFEVWWSSFYLRTNRTLMRAIAAERDQRLEVISMHLDEVHHFVRRAILATLHSSSVPNRTFWLNVALVFTINARRAFPAMTLSRPLHRLSWASAQFSLEWTNAMQDPEIVPQAARGLDPNAFAASQAIIITDQPDQDEPAQSTVACFHCSGPHFAKHCPNVSEEMRAKHKQPKKKKKRKKKRQRPQQNPYSFTTKSLNHQLSNQIQQSNAMMMERIDQIADTCRGLSDGTNSKRKKVSPPSQVQVLQQSQSQPNGQKRHGEKYYDAQGKLKDCYKGSKPCPFFENRIGNTCHFDQATCRWAHFCRNCFATDHSKWHCDQGQGQRM